MATLYLMTRAEIGDAAFFEAFQAALAEMKAAGRPMELVDRRESDVSIQLAWLGPGDRLVVKVIDDYLANARYLEMHSPDQAELDEVARVLRSHLDIQELPELVAEASAHLDERHDLVQRLALAGPARFDQAIFDVVTRALSSRDGDLRRRGAHAAGVLSWRQFVPPLETALANEPPGEVKSHLSTALRLARGESS